MNKYTLKLALVLLVIFITAANVSASPVRYVFEGNVSLEKQAGSLFEPPVDQTPFQNLAFRVRVDADTDDITSRKLAGLGTSYNVSGSNIMFNIENLGDIVLDSPGVYSTPGVFVVGFFWGERDIAQRGSVAFYGAYSFLDKNILDDDVYLRTDWFSSPFLIYPDAVYRISGFSNVSYSVSSVPLPSTVLLLLSGLGMVYKFSRRNIKPR